MKKRQNILLAGEIWDGTVFWAPCHTMIWHGILPRSPIPSLVWYGFFMGYPVRQHIRGTIPWDGISVGWMKKIPFPAGVKFRGSALRAKTFGKALWRQYRPLHGARKARVIYLSCTTISTAFPTEHTPNIHTQTTFFCTSTSYPHTLPRNKQIQTRLHPYIHHGLQNLRPFNARFPPTLNPPTSPCLQNIPIISSPTGRDRDCYARAETRWCF